MSSATLRGTEFNRPTRTAATVGFGASCSLQRIRAPETDYSLTPREASAGCTTTLTTLGDSTPDRAESPVSFA